MERVNMETYTLSYVSQIANGHFLYDSGNSNQGSVTTQKGAVGREVLEGEDQICPQLIYIDIWQKPTQECKAVILQLKINRASLVGQMAKNPPAMWETGFDPWVGKILWRRKWQHTPIFLPGESQGQRNLADYILSMASQELDTTQPLNHHQK